MLRGYESVDVAASCSSEGGLVPIRRGVTRKVGVEISSQQRPGAKARVGQLWFAIDRFIIL